MNTSCNHHSHATLFFTCIAKWNYLSLNPLNGICLQAGQFPATDTQVEEEYTVLYGLQQQYYMYILPKKKAGTA